MQTPYSKNYFPPAPTLLVSIAGVGENPQITAMPGLVDTSADGTFVPTSLLEELNLPAIYVTNVRSHLADTLRRASVFQVDLIINSLRLPSIEVVGDDWGSEITLGRDVLNKLQLFLDGPRQIVEIR